LLISINIITIRRR